MKNRLRRREREAVRSKYAQGEGLFKALAKGAREVEKRTGHFRFSAEELFVEVMTVVDNVKEYPQGAVDSYDHLWDDLYCDYRDLDTADSPDEEIRLAASEVVYGVMLLTGFCPGTHYTRLGASLMAQLEGNHAGALDTLNTVFLPNIWLLGEEKVQARMRAYMEGEEWISDDIVGMLESLPEENVSMAVEGKTDSTKGGAAGLTNRQLVILFEHLLNVSLKPEFTNVKAMATLLGEVSGRSAGSIRQVIMKGIDYESAGVHMDIDRLEALLRPISEKTADVIKNSKEEF